VVILSDYGKGGLTHIAEMIALARAAGKPVLVDPKGDDYAQVCRGDGDYAEPFGTARSGRALDVEADLAPRPQKLARRTGLEALLVTRSEEGMTLFAAEGEACITRPWRLKYLMFPVPAIRSSPRWRSCWAGADWAEAIRTANVAAGIVVGKLGTAVVTREELAAAL
jgi:bifunctional ADP-heptose synthase (sugar kinase/adenylyltransferase)